MSNQSLKKLGSDLKFVYSDNNSISVIFQNNDLLMGVVGEFNSNLKELEKLTNSTIYFRGNSILIKNGAKEITLLGQNVNAYSYFENSKEYKLSDLIMALEKFTELKEFDIQLLIL